MVLDESYTGFWYLYGFTVLESDADPVLFVEVILKTTGNVVPSSDSTFGNVRSYVFTHPVVLLSVNVARFVVTPPAVICNVAVAI